MNSRSVFSYSQYHRTIVLYLSYRNDIFMGAAFHHKNSKKNKVLIYISTLENHRKAGVGKSPNQSFLFI